ncbi:S-methyl-5-thioribose-1-phosphate isomerase [Methylocystis bryophila]|uniref:Methylthioribose-1-phosphate isomerase n=1 Tax=Methylocystis bryophila TaxID=655015 RepID=A0A1W6N0F4_9HYPH|nr:S-methyl-5-thioribose-1-phosphate isomerase [Methylocystis bryophila]ARN83279.1 S-methyl-5-thioribose-1-phosphate isomerase [Methylocystis bryophila]
MEIEGRHYRTIWLDEDGATVHVIDQTKLPFRFETRGLASVEAAARAISDMVVRGAPLIGVTGAYGLALAARQDASEAALRSAHAALLATRPTAINLKWALDRVLAKLLSAPIGERAAEAFAEAGRLADEDAACCEAIGENGFKLIEEAARRKGGRVNILTHCNAGWLATVDWGTAIAPIYKAARAGIDLHVWVDETRPRNQGASLTAFELGAERIAHTVIVDNAGGHLMQHGEVDLCIVGSDRTTRQGDVCNKIGTYLKALAAHANDVPFYVALPGSTLDWRLSDGVAEIPIEERSGDEVSFMQGLTDAGEVARVRVTPQSSPAKNFGFDVTPARYVTALVTERGVCAASEKGLRELFPHEASL